MMRCRTTLRGSLVALAMVGMVVPTSSFATEPVAQPIRPAISVIDVSLTEDGRLRGQVLDLQGVPAADTTVAVVHQGEVVATMQTDAQGRYSVAGLNTGLYQVVTEEGITVCRVWTAKTAPPSAQPEALVIHGNHTMRAERGGTPWASFLTNPWVLGGIVAAAIAIPVALHYAEEPASP